MTFSAFKHYINIHILDIPDLHGPILLIVFYKQMLQLIFANLTHEFITKSLRFINNVATDICQFKFFDIFQSSIAD